MTTEIKNKSRREMLTKSAYIVPAVLTMAIAPSFTSNALAGGGACGSKTGCAPTPVSEPGVIGLLGLGLAGVAVSRLLKKNKDRKDKENS